MKTRLRPFAELALDAVELRRLFAGGAVTLTPRGRRVRPRADLLLEAVLREKTSTPAQERGGRCPRVVARGPQLDFPVQQIQGVADVWVPFSESIAVGWG
jgi:hypothetical protein